jgi:hypothetical protein
LTASTVKGSASASSTTSVGAPKLESSRDFIGIGLPCLGNNSLARSLCVRRRRPRSCR